MIQKRIRYLRYVIIWCIFGPYERVTYKAWKAVQRIKASPGKRQTGGGTERRY